MAYVGNALQLIASNINGTLSLFFYQTNDYISSVLSEDYFSDGVQRGLSPGCIVFVVARGAVYQTSVTATSGGGCTVSLVTESYSGSVGQDFSGNQPMPPLLGQVFASAPYAGYVQISMVPLNVTRACINVENTSGNQIILIFDDGTAGPFDELTNVTIFAIGGGPSPGNQGGSYSSDFEKRRLQVYAPSASAQIAVWQN